MIEFEINGHIIKVQVDLDGSWYIKSDLPEDVTESDVENAVDNWKFDIEQDRGRRI